MKRLLMTGLLIFGAISSGRTAMAKKIDKEALANKIKALAGLDAEERSELLGLLSERKKYGLVWEEKPEDVEEVMREQLPVLAEVKERAIVASAPSAPNHILIEGDNLHALTCLTYTHSNKVDVIYIDPPYNTGNKDFVYNDRFVDKEDAFRHSKWLSFMEKRLRIAKGLLGDKGVIFISIDDNEFANLKLLCDEIFGERNCLATVVQKSRDSISGDLLFSPNHNYLLVYAKKQECVFNERDIFRIPVVVDESKFKNPDNDPRGPWKLNPVDGPGGARKGNPYYEFLGITGSYRYSKEMMQKYYDDGLIVKRRNSLGKKYFLSQAKAKKGVPPTTPFWAFFSAEQFGTAESAKNELSQILGRKDHGFETVKPSQMLSEIIFQATKDNSIVLDFFAGSGTTLQATLEVNSEYGGKRTCILVTNNENGICEKVTYERNRRVIQGYTNAKGEAVPGLQDNSLRYYKTEFVPRRPSPRNARALMAASVDLLCVKNDLYDEVSRFFGKKLKKSAGRYFDDGRGRRMLVLFDETTVPSVAETIRGASFKGKVKIYVFAHGDYAYNEEFEEVADKVELCALPAAIRNAYRRVIGKYRPQEEDAK